MIDLPRLRPLAAAAGLLALAACAGRTPPPGPRPAKPINYYVRVAGEDPGAYDVTMAADRVQADSLDFHLPVWMPGRYGAGRTRPLIENFTARDGSGRPVPMRRLTVSSWRVYPRDTDYLTLEYRVEPGTTEEPLPFRTQIRAGWGHALGAGLFGVLQGQEERPVTLAFDLPAGWRVYAPLEPGGPNRFSTGRYGALAVAPFALGTRVRSYKLFLQGHPHEVIVQGAGPAFVPDSLLALVQEAVDLGTRFLGPAPYDRYLFEFDFVDPEVSGIGATGQAAGSAYFLPALDSGRLREAGLGTVLLHQYLHAWIPSTFGPVALRRPDFRIPPDASGLWFVEGVAEYYARLLPVRYGLRDRQVFYQGLGELLTWWRDLGGGARIAPRELGIAAQRTGEDEKAWTRLVVGGTLSSFLLDLSIREETRGLRGLDQIVYYLQRAGAEGYSPGEMWPTLAEAIGVPQATIEPALSSRGMSIEEGLARAGLRSRVVDERRRTLGARLTASAEGGFVVGEVESGGTAAGAGIRSGDVLTEINATPVGPDETVATRYALDTYIRDAKTGAPIAFTVVRDGTPRQLKGTVREGHERRVVIEEATSAGAGAELVRNSLFTPSLPAAGR